MHIKPLSDVVIIEQQKLEKVGDILNPIESADFREDIGTIICCGPEADKVQAGDKVLFSTHGHQVTKIDGREMIVLRQNSIIGVLNA